MKQVIIIFKSLLIYFLFPLVFLKAQVSEEWIRTYNGAGIGGYYGDKASIDKFGNFIVAGRGGFNNPDYLILKYSSSGNLLWVRNYNGPENDLDWFKDMVLDDSGNVYVTGFSWEGSNFGGQNWVTIKYNSTGDLKWKQSLDWTGHNADQPYKIYLDKNRNVLVSGYGFVGPGSFSDDIVTAKYNSDGKLLWTKSYNCFGTLGDWGYSVVSDDSCNVYVSGYSKLQSNPSLNVIVTIKYDSLGNQIWFKEFLRANAEYALPMYSKIDKNNNVVICGNYNGNTDFVTLKYDTQGNLLWNRYFNGVGNNLDFCKAMFIDDSCFIYICGRSALPTTSHDVLLIKYKPNGDTSFIKYYDNGNSLDDEAFSIRCDSTGNIYLAGSTTIIGDDFLTLKYNSSGDLLWAKTYSLPLSNVAYCIDIDKHNNIYVAGFRDSSFYSAVVCIKYSQLTEVKGNNNIIISNYNLTNYPNPFNPYTTVKYEIPESGQVRITVYDNNGKKIELLTNEYRTKGMYEVKFNGESFSSGLYFYSLTVNNKIRKTNKMLLTK